MLGIVMSIFVVSSWIYLGMWALVYILLGIWAFTHAIRDAMQTHANERHKGLRSAIGLLISNPAEAENKALCEALENLFHACVIADSVEELSDQVDGGLLDAARKALAGKTASGPS